MIGLLTVAVLVLMGIAIWQINNIYQLIQNKLGNKKFDFILDDGPHTLESQIEFIKIYKDYLSENGILIIEDIKDLNHINIFLNTVNPELRNKCRHIDCRNGKNSSDSIIFILEK